jgi:hypothetical protein
MADPDPAPAPRVKRPWPVALAGVIFLGAPLLMLAVQVALTLKKGLIDWSSYATVAVLLLAGLFWLGRPRSAATYYLGGVALTACTLRFARTAWIWFHMPSAPPDYAKGSATATLLMALLTWNYLFGKKSLAYFSLEKK